MLPARRAGSMPGAFVESFWDGKIGEKKKRGRGGFIPWKILCPFFPHSASWEFVGSQQVPSPEEASHPSWEPWVSGAAGGCPSGRSACQIGASPSPALFIYLLNPPPATSTHTPGAGFPLSH